MKRSLNAAQKAEIEALERRHRGFVTAQTIVAFAENPKTALHSAFDWDDTIAARNWRLVQARNLLRVYVIHYENTPEPVHGFISLSPDRACPGGGYTAMGHILSDEGKRTQMLEDAFAELRAFRRKYAILKELAAVFEAIDSLPKRQRLRAVQEARLDA